MEEEEGHHFLWNQKVEREERVRDFFCKKLGEGIEKLNILKKYIAPAFLPPPLQMNDCPYFG